MNQMTRFGAVLLSASLLSASLSGCGTTTQEATPAVEETVVASQVEEVVVAETEVETEVEVEAEPEVEAEVEAEAEPEAEVEAEPEPEAEPEVEPEVEVEVEVEAEPEVEIEVEVEAEPEVEIEVPQVEVEVEPEVEVQQETVTETIELSADMDVYAVTDPFLVTAGMAGDTVIATAGDMEITAQELLYQASYLADSYLADYADYGITSIYWSADMGDGTTLGDALMADALESAVFYGMMDDVATEAGIYLTAEEEASVASITADLVATIGSEQAAQLIYLYTPITPAYYEEVYRSGYLSNVVINTMLAEGGELDLSDEEIIDYAEEELGIYGAKHILFMTLDYYTGSALSDEEIAEKLALAEEVLAELERSDDPITLFDEMMDKYSDDGRDETTGALYYPDGYNATPGYMVTSFEEAALALEVGEISGIVESEYGYHIILRTDLHVDDSLVSSCQSALVSDVETSWLAGYPVTTTQAFDSLDLEAFYNNLITFRTIVSVELEVLLGY